MMIKRLLLTVAACAVATSVNAATLTVCADVSCTYTNAQLQTALNAAVAGDVILLQQGYTYVGVFTLNKHGGASMVTLRTGVTSTGALVPLSVFPAAGIRMTPELAASANLAKIQSTTNNLAALGTENPSAGSSPRFWTVQWVEFLWNTGSSIGSGTVVSCGSDSNSTVTNDAEIPNNITFDQVYIRGHASRGQFRGFSAHCDDLALTNSRIDNIKSTAEGNAFWCNSFRQNLTVTNNYIEGGAEVVFCGGSGGASRKSRTVTAATSATSFTIDDFTGLYVGQGFTVETAGIGTSEEYAEVVSCGTSVAEAACTSGVITVAAGSLSGTPVVGTDMDYGLNPKNLTFRYNHITRPVSHRSAVLGAPQGVTAVSATTGGATLAPGTYYYRIVATTTVGGGYYVSSAASAEVPVTVAAPNNSVTVSWAAVSNALNYRVYGRSSGGQNIYFGTTAPTVTTTDTGGAGTSHAMYTGSGYKYQVKNLFEIKNASKVTIEYNLIENTWCCDQGGYALVITPVNQSDTNDSSRIQDLTIRYNHIRHAAGGINMSGRDVDGSLQPSGRLSRVMIEHNLFSDISSTWGTSLTRGIQMTTRSRHANYAAGTPMGPLGVTIRKNTFVLSGINATIFFDLFKTVSEPCVDCVYDNNISYKMAYGVTGNNACTQGNGCWTQHTSGAASWQNNLTADCTAANYPGGTAENFCPTSAALAGEFVDAAAGNYALKSTSTYTTAASDGGRLGADISGLTTFINIAVAGDMSGGTVVVPPSIETSTLPGGTVDSAYSASVTGTCPTTPCTWGAYSLPPNTTLTPVSSTAATISGTPLTGGTTEPGVTLTDAGGRVATRTYTVTIADVVAPTEEPPTDGGSTPPPVLPRADRDWLHERVLFGRELDPSVRQVDADNVLIAAREPVKVGDLWAQLSTPPALKMFTAIAPTPVTVTFATTTDLTTLDATNLTTGTVPDGRFPATLPVISGINLTALNASNLGSGTVPLARIGASGTPSATTFLNGLNAWATPAGGSSGGPISVVHFLPMDTVWTDMPAADTEFKGSNIRRTRIDMTGSNTIRLGMSLNSGVSTGATIRVQYSTDLTTWTDMGTSITSAVQGLQVATSWATVPAGAKADVFLRLMGQGGDGVADPGFLQVFVQVK